jgi:hypothetical protein
MKTKPQRTLAAAAAITSGLLVGHTQSASIAVPAAPGTPPPPKPAAKLGATEQWMQDAKKPLPWLTWGADFRVRDEYYDNIVTLTGSDLPGTPANDALRSEQNVVRFRPRLWTAITPVTNVTFNTRLSAESRYWTEPSFVGAYRGKTGMEWRYGLIDNLNVKWNNAFDQPLTITAGRQDITIGDFWNWWLVADGTPGDGSWSYFLDSARVTYDLKSAKTKVDLIGIYQNARPDGWLPTIDNSSDYFLTEQDETGAILYLSNKSLKNTTLDGFFVYKGDHAQAANGDNADIYTVGGRVAGNPGEHWSYNLEGAYQFGEKQDPTVRTPYALGGETRDIGAFGGNAKLSYLCRDPLNNQFHLVYEYLSGDDPDTQGTDEMFDILWGRWPRFSELYIYSYLNETSGKIAQLNNIQRIGGGWTLAPMKNMHFGAYYNALFAPEETPTRTMNAALFSQDGNFRGHYLQSVLTHTFSKHMKGHLWAEFIWQGDYYTADDLLTFLRAEVSFTF